MAGRPEPHVLVDEIERLIQVDVGRNITGLFDAARGALWGAASALATARSARVGLITGFYVPQGSPPAAETDGPLGTALLAKGLLAVGIPCRVATDEPCGGACAAALAGAGVPDVVTDAVALGAPLAPLIETWRRTGITHAISIERCGRSADGAPRNMRGEDIGSYTAPLDDLFSAGPWETIAIGDGGNEIGMGAISRFADCAACRARRDDCVRNGGAASDRGRCVELGGLRVDRRACRASRRLASDAARLSRRNARPRSTRGDDRTRPGRRRRIALADPNRRQPRHCHTPSRIAHDPHIGRARTCNIGSSFSNIIHTIPRSPPCPCDIDLAAVLDLRKSWFSISRLVSFHPRRAWLLIGSFV